MFLTKEEEKILSGERGEAKKKAAQLVTALGDIYGADKLIPVSSVQVAGVSYKTIGDAGIDFLNFFIEKKASVSIPTFLNPAGCDVEQWKAMKINEKFATKQKEILEIFSKLGITTTCTCVPYQIGIVPKKGEHIAWSESSAVAFANSVLGARTNREGGPSALAAAILGKTANYGYHLDEKRVATHHIKVSFKLEDQSDFGLLGIYVGKLVQDGIPAFELSQKASIDELKALGAAMAAAGAVALFFVKGQTPEWFTGNADKIEVEESELRTLKESLNTGHAPDLVAVGCPHCSINEIKKISENLKGRKLKKPLWICTARKIKKLSDEKGYTSIIEKAGGRIVCDTCAVVSPIESLGYKITATNSGKEATYLPSFCKQRVNFGKLEQLIE
ncbi:MAG: aconitase X catalytic domain-containing protein [Candidatus Aenigmarchaeota archaeon]|nr:aconitase X catalytic domain-containing protein [Candidatus Aenigmarchaeota archaeon]